MALWCGLHPTTGAAAIEIVDDGNKDGFAHIALVWARLDPLSPIQAHCIDRRESQVDDDDGFDYTIMASVGMRGRSSTSTSLLLFVAFRACA